MAKMLIDRWVVNGKSSYPDDYKLFKGLEPVEWNGNEYFYTDYSGQLNLETGDTAAYEASLAVKTGIRIIGVRSFVERIAAIDKAILKSIRKSANEDVQLVMDGLNYYSTYVDLDHPITQRDLNTLVAAGELTQAQADSLLVDGQDFEAYRGTL